MQRHDITCNSKQFDLHTSCNFITERCSSCCCCLQESASDGYATSDDESSSDSGESPQAAGSDDDIDMEDLGGRVASGKAASTSQPAAEQQETAAPRDMLTPALRANLSKQGYKLIGKSTWCVWCCFEVHIDMDVAPQLPACIWQSSQYQSACRCIIPTANNCC